MSFTFPQASTFPSLMPGQSFSSIQPPVATINMVSGNAKTGKTIGKTVMWLAPNGDVFETHSFYKNRLLPHSYPAPVGHITPDNSIYTCPSPYLPLVSKIAQITPKGDLLRTWMGINHNPNVLDKLLAPKMQANGYFKSFFKTFIVLGNIPQPQKMALALLFKKRRSDISSCTTGISLTD